MKISLHGKVQVQIDDGKFYDAQLPGTLDTNQIGYKEKGATNWHPDITLDNLAMVSGEFDVIGTRFTRRHTYMGPATFTKHITYTQTPHKRTFIEVERARHLTLLINGQNVPHFAPPTISTPHIFEVTNLLNNETEITFISDNSYPGWPKDAIICSSAATDETQTNWNGLIGEINLIEKEPVFISHMGIYPKKDTLTVKIEIAANLAYEGTIHLTSPALACDAKLDIAIEAGTHEFVMSDLPLKSDVLRWDEFCSNLYELTATLTDFDSLTACFGIRDFASNEEGRLTLNDRVFFMRSEANCAVFPETGHPPMTVNQWKDILNTYKSYGVNLMRFHSHCPPKAAFIAADEMGMMMHPELSHWNPKDAFESEESDAYYQTELREMVKYLANHPSFVMLAFGNELWASELGHNRMTAMLADIKIQDDTRLFASGSNNHYGLEGCDGASDFQSLMKFVEPHLHLRAASPGQNETGQIEGFINEKYPNTTEDFNIAMDALRENYKKPVFGFEVGQFEILPDFDEINDFNGVSLPENYKLIKERVENHGNLLRWKEYVEATGEISLLCYRAEIEAALRTERLSGLSLLGLQDFPGQGTALVGMLNAHLHPKPYSFAQPEKFAAFFTDQLPLVLLPKYTYENTEKLTAVVKIANYGKHDITKDLCITLTGGEFTYHAQLKNIAATVGRLTTVGTIEIELNTITEATRLELTVEIDQLRNRYPIWVYPDVAPALPANIHETTTLDEESLRILADGGTVYLSPPSTARALPNSIPGQFSTDFWSVGTFPKQAGGMGLLIEKDHPIFKGFPTESHTNWQWWLMASSRAVILPKEIKPIITQMDSYAYLRPMGMLFEGVVGRGKVLVSTMGLQDLQTYPEARALLMSIYHYMASPVFKPEQPLQIDMLQQMVK